MKNISENFLIHSKDPLNYMVKPEFLVEMDFLSNQNYIP